MNNNNTTTSPETAMVMDVLLHYDSEKLKEAIAQLSLTDPDHSVLAYCLNVIATYGLMVRDTKRPEINTLPVFRLHPLFALYLSFLDLHNPKNTNGYMHAMKKVHNDFPLESFKEHYISANLDKIVQSIEEQAKEENRDLYVAYVILGWFGHFCDFICKCFQNEFPGFGVQFAFVDYVRRLAEAIDFPAIEIIKYQIHLTLGCIGGDVTQENLATLQCNQEVALMKTKWVLSLLMDNQPTQINEPRPAPLHAPSGEAIIEGVVKFSDFINPKIKELVLRLEHRKFLHSGQLGNESVSNSDGVGTSDTQSTPDSSIIQDPCKPNAIPFEHYSIVERHGVIDDCLTQMCHKYECISKETYSSFFKLDNLTQLRLFGLCVRFSEQESEEKKKMVMEQIKLRLSNLH